MKANKVIINIAQQKLSVFSDDQPISIKTCLISTAAKGVGNKKDSFQTPVGRHIIHAKIGEGLPIGAVLVGRQWTGELYDDALAKQFPNRDWILTRILWLSGCEPGVNQGGLVDSMARYIYIHGTAYEDLLGTPCSKGCIRVSNKDVIELFNLLQLKTTIKIINS